MFTPAFTSSSPQVCRLFTELAFNTVVLTALVCTWALYCLMGVFGYDLSLSKCFISVSGCFTARHVLVLLKRAYLARQLANRT